MVWSADGRCENVGVIKKEASGLIVNTFSVREDPGGTSGGALLARVSRDNSRDRVRNLG